VSSATVRAAGGVVVRAGGDVLVIHRPQYDDWSLPKGKVDPGEDEPTAAVREVEEETGVRAAITREVGAIEYLDRRGRNKTVRYFMMTVDHDPGMRVADDEVDIVEWWPLERARVALTYERDRELLLGLDVIA
jgi:8-oxo-dGTP pyrophosphatase MutT (NUDIX family)